MSNRSIKSLEINGKLPEIINSRSRSETSQRRNSQDLPLSGRTYTEDIIEIPKPTADAENDIKKVIKDIEKGDTNKERNSSRKSSVSIDNRKELNDTLVSDQLDDSFHSTESKS